LILKRTVSGSLDPPCNLGVPPQLIDKTVGWIIKKVRTRCDRGRQKNQGLTEMLCESFYFILQTVAALLPFSVQIHKKIFRLSGRVCEIKPKLKRSRVTLPNFFALPSLYINIL